METNQQKPVGAAREKASVSEKVKTMVKEFAQAKKAIKTALKSGEKTIPQIARETGLMDSQVTYFLMTMLKFGDVVAGDMDDDDEYYFYRLKQEK